MPLVLVVWNFFRRAHICNIFFSMVLGFTKSMALEVGSRGIRVNMIEPGFIETEMTKGVV